jgi:hypothetical protein
MSESTDFGALVAAGASFAWRMEEDVKVEMKGVTFKEEGRAYILFTGFPFNP